MLSTILVPTDGSAHADKAVELAGDLAGKYGAKVVLLHILLRGHMPEGLMRAAQVEHLGKTGGQPANLVNMPQEIMARVEGKKGTQVPLEVLEFIGKRVLAGAEQACRDKGAKSVELAVEEGNPTEIILAYARRAKGRHDRHGQPRSGRPQGSSDGQHLRAGESPRAVHLRDRQGSLKRADVSPYSGTEAVLPPGGPVDHAMITCDLQRLRRHPVAE